MSGRSSPRLQRWLFWGWLVLAPATVAGLAYSIPILQACRAVHLSASPPECGPGLTLRPGESCSVTIPAAPLRSPSMLLPSPSRAPHGLFPPRVVPS